MAWSSELAPSGRQFRRCLTQVITRPLFPKKNRAPLRGEKQRKCSKAVKKKSQSGEIKSPDAKQPHETQQGRYGCGARSRSGRQNERTSNCCTRSPRGPHELDLWNYTRRRTIPRHFPPYRLHHTRIEIPQTCRRELSHQTLFRRCCKSPHANRFPTDMWSQLFPWQPLPIPVRSVSGTSPNGSRRPLHTNSHPPLAV